jgi:hypothetical protein
MFTERMTRLRQSLSLSLFNLIHRLLFSRWVGVYASDYSEQHSAYEGSYSVRIGPWQLDLNDCFVLDHRDATVSLRLPCPCREQVGGRLGRWRWGQVRLSYTVALGQEQIRPSGWSGCLTRPLVTVMCDRLEDNPHIPF